jgi:hypothetical protein
VFFLPCLVYQLPTFSRFRLHPPQTPTIWRSSDKHLNDDFKFLFKRSLIIFFGW